MKQKKQWWSVMLLYPSYLGGDAGDSWYDFVRATNRNEAVANARKKLMEENGWVGEEADAVEDLEDLVEVLVLKGRQKGV